MADRHSSVGSRCGHRQDPVVRDRQARAAEPGCRRGQPGPHHRARHRERRQGRPSRAWTSSRSPSTSRSGRTRPARSRARSSVVRAVPPRTPSSPAGSPTARCARPSPTASATRPRSCSRSSAPTSTTRTTCSAINAASAALMISGIPFDGPIGAVRIAYRPDGEWIPHPPTKRATPARSSWSSPVASSTTATSRS